MKDFAFSLPSQGAAPPLNWSTLSCIRKFCYCWTCSYFKFGKTCSHPAIRKKSFSNADLIPVESLSSTHHLADQLHLKWCLQLRSPHPSLGFTLFAVFWPPILKNALIAFFA